MNNIIHEIKEFLFNTSVMNLLIAVVLGKAFGELIQSTVSDIILPMIGYISGNVDFSELYIVLGKQTLNYGKTIDILITVIISVLTLYYIFIKPFHSIIEENEKKKEEKQIYTMKKILNIHV